MRRGRAGPRAGERARRRGRALQCARDRGGRAVPPGAAGDQSALLADHARLRNRVAALRSGIGDRIAPYRDPMAPTRGRLRPRGRAARGRRDERRRRAAGAAALDAVAGHHVRRHVVGSPRHHAARRRPALAVALRATARRMRGRGDVPAVSGTGRRHRGSGEDASADRRHRSLRLPAAARHAAAAARHAPGLRHPALLRRRTCCRGTSPYTDGALLRSLVHESFAHDPILLAAQTRIQLYFVSRTCRRAGPARP